MKFERLGNIIDIQKGKKPSFVETKSEKSTRVLQIDDLRNDNNFKYTDDKKGVLAGENDVLLAWDGANAGTIGYGKSGYIGSTIALLRIKEPKKYSTTFIGKFLQTQYNFLRSKSTGATIPHISRKALEDLKIPVIEVSDQIHIANFLSKAEILISQRKESIRHLDEYLKSTFLKMFGDPVTNEKNWEIVDIENVCKDIFLGLTNKVDYVENGGYPLVRTTDIKGGKLSFENVRYISEEQHKRITKNRISKRGDILVSKSGTLGTTAIVDSDIEFTTYESIITIQTEPQKLVNHFLNFLLRNSNFQIKILGGKTGGTVGHLNLLMFRNITLPLPPIELQNKFAEIVEKTEALKTQYQQSLQELENLYGVLSQKAFKGELKIKSNDTTTNE